MVLLAIALFGLIVPNGIFIYWLIYEYPGLLVAMQNKPAVALMLDAFMAVGVLAYHFARQPRRGVTWPWFVALSLLGGLGFSVPFYLWLTGRQSASGSL